MAGDLTNHVATLARQHTAAWPTNPGIPDLNELLRLLSRWRSQLLANTYIAQLGTRILGGPFAGMEYLAAATEGALIPRLLGTYESELHPYLQKFADAGLDCVIDVGCAEGYYAVGLARLMPSVAVHAFDTADAARKACAALAEKNGVADRVVIGETFLPNGFEAFSGRRVLVMVDAEGAEVDILQPDVSPALATMNVIVETHDLFRPGVLATMIERFSSTHHIVRIDQRPKVFEVPQWLQALPHLDQLLAVWEWRMQPTPWLVMTPRTSMSALQLGPG